jgi:hypothetical protein
VDIAAWLNRLGLEQYEQAFRENDVDAEVLLELTAKDLIGLGVTSIGRLPKAPRGHRRPCLPTQRRLGAFGCRNIARFRAGGLVSISTTVALNSPSCSRTARMSAPSAVVIDEQAAVQPSRRSIAGYITHRHDLHVL